MEQDNILENVSLSKLVITLKLVVNDIKLPLNIITNHLNLYCHHSMEHLSKIANIVHFKNHNNLRDAFFTKKRLLSMDTEQISERLDLILNEYGCSVNQLIQSLQILELSVDEIRNNFKKFQNITAFKLYSNNVSFLRLIYDIDLAIKNFALLNLNDISIKYTTIDNLLRSANNFSNLIKNNNFKLKLNSVTQMNFSISLKEIRQKIGKYKSVSRSLNAINTENIITFFRNNNLTDEQIINGIYLIYFDFEEIQQAWFNMFNQSDLINSGIDWRKHSFVLQLLFHFIEKSHKNIEKSAISQ